MGTKQYLYSVNRIFAVVAVAATLASGALAANKEKVIYSFSGGSDGGDPHSTLIFDGAGNAYGTTIRGGDLDFGTVFKLTPNSNGKWTETVLYSFLAGSDGKNPYGGVIMDSKGNLYGTTAAGGGGGVCAGDGCGIVFKLTRSGKNWTESILYSFQGGKDGWDPGGGLVSDPQGNFYGTTADGGTADGCNGQGCGTVYQLSPAKGGQWKERVIHRFTNGKDGSRGSLGALVLDKGGSLYGVAELGGALGAGTVFKMTRAFGGKWSFSTIHAFKGLPHPGYPYGGVIFDSNGNLYGTTYFGGANGAGSVFKLTNSNGKWKESLLYSFQDGQDGSLPTCGLVFDAKGNLYGTTSEGGDTNGDGIIFKLTPAGGNWKETVVHRFGPVPDGTNPFYGLVIDKAGNHLYGTAPFGGVSNMGAVFELTP
jgi:uncharacterized repeat protein (TIGR03803 family)